MPCMQELFEGVSETSLSFKGNTLDEVEHNTQSVFLFEIFQGYETIYHRRKIYGVQA
jgi:hypothetical protein